LIGIGTPRKGACSPASRRRSASAPGHGVQLAVALVDRREAGVEQLDGGELAPAQCPGQLECG
jgi:hypothetical protein